MNKIRIALLSLLLFFLTVGYKTGTVKISLPKIYLIDSLLIKAEPGSHIKIFDIQNPRQPRHLSTINIKGNTDVAAAGYYLYADNNTDLIIYNIYNPSAPLVVDTIKNIFEQSYFDDFYYIDEVGGADGCDCQDGTPVSSTNVRTSGGRGGSLARFAVTKNHLYCIDYSSLYIFDLNTPAYPTFRAKISVGWDVETIFPYRDYLFIGGMNGMYVYNLINPASPVQTSVFTHARACDPVVVENDLAYITLRSGTACGASANALHIVDISNVSQPRQLQSFLMDGPYGLDVQNKIVYVCDGIGGLKVISTVDLSNIKILNVIGNIFPYDCIVDKKLLYVNAQNGVLIYDLSSENPPTLLSTLR